MKDKNYRSLLKAISWRVTGTVDTIVISFLITGNIKIASSIGAIEVITKIILYYLHERIWALTDWGKTTTQNVKKQEFTLEKKRKTDLTNTNGKVLWFIGLSGAGKSTIANIVEQNLHEMKIHTKILDGDNLRLGLNNDLGFSKKDRDENLRRVAEVAKLFSDNATTVLCCFITPLESQREMIKSILGDDVTFIYVKANMASCEKRDVKGLYKKAREGKIADFTGISSPFEEPKSANLIINTEEISAPNAAQLILDYNS